MRWQMIIALVTATVFAWSGVALIRYLNELTYDSKLARRVKRAKLKEYMESRKNKG